MITKSLVRETDRVNFLPRVFGNNYLLVEANAFSTMDELSRDYNGGLWEFYDLSNGAGYMVPSGQEELEIRCSGNYFTGVMSADAAGVVATLFAVNKVLWVHPADATLQEVYYAILDYVRDHPERKSIMGAID